MDSQEPQEEYRVLARKYRPQSFDDLIGQSALVRTLKNAITSGRVAHAFMLTGVRGVGKTTTARIIAKALNYAGPDGKGEPTIGNTDDCDIAQAITLDRHPDVMEMDAASRTGIDDISEILEGVRYAPVSARYKIYIIDEVHMLSKAAFNALLKTLEEPPAHVKFIFATTEIRKVPVTILSRCQRFDLARVSQDELEAHFQKICQAEGYSIEDEALSAIARSADGSVRDGLSILDQAMALSDNQDITGDSVAAMLGLGDRVMTLTLLESAMQGNVTTALETLSAMHQKGTDPMIIVEDMMDMLHGLMITQALDGKGDASSMTAGSLPHAESQKAVSLALQIGLPGLNRAWQIMLKGLSELRQAPNPSQALSILILRLSHSAHLPDPGRLIKQLQGSASVQAQGAVQQTHTAPAAGTPLMQQGAPSSTVTAKALDIQAQPQEVPAPITSVEDIVALCENHGALILAQSIRDYVHPSGLKPGHFEFFAAPDAPPQLASDIGKHLTEWTGTRWVISLCASSDQPTLAQKEAKAQEDLTKRVMDEPIVGQLLTLFPNAQLRDIIAIKEGED